MARVEVFMQKTTVCACGWDLVWQDKTWGLLANSQARQEYHERYCFTALESFKRGENPWSAGAHISIYGACKEENPPWLASS